MKKLTNKILSSILTLSMIFSLAVPTYATENFNDETDSIITEEIIEDAREVYNSLTPEAKAIFDASLAYDSEMLEFHLTYIDKNFTPPTTPKMRVNTMAASTDPMRVLMTQLGGLGLPSAVLYSLKAMGASMVAAIADGPLPVGDILLAAATASTIVVIAANWKVVSPKMNQITKAFQTAFASSKSNVSSAFAKIKREAKKEAEKGEKKPTGNKVKDVHKRLKKEGFKKTGQSGSHEKWKKGDRTVTVPNHGLNTEIPIGTLRSIWRQAGWIN